jgi:hypothetical protein
MEPDIQPPVMTPSMTNVNGILPVANNSMLEAAANARREAENKNNEPVMQGLAA